MASKSPFSSTLRALLRALAGVAALTSCSASNSAGSSSDGPIPGFADTFDTTKCWLGSDVRSSRSGVESILTGSTGFEYVDLANGMFVCNADWPPVQGPKPSEESADVLAYFSGLGMPMDQVGTLGMTYASGSNGAVFSNLVVDRVVDGIPVAESRATAGLVEGKAIQELVYWPALPASLWTELSTFQAIVNDPGKLASFQSHIAGFIAGSLVIHHTGQNAIDVSDPTAPVPIVAHVCYDAVVQDGPTSNLGTTACYLADGTQFTFPDASFGP